MALSAVKNHIERALDKNLSDLVRGIRAHKDDEAKFICDCIDEIKHELKTGNFASKANAANKLAYLQMLGYDISWAAFNIVEVMSSQKFTFKRVGYLAASQSFGDHTDVLMLTTNLIRKDLNSGKTYETSVALSGLSCFMTEDLARDLCADITALTSSPKPYIRKKAVLLLYKVFLKHPDALRASFPRLRDKLEDPDQGVQSAAVNVICELARKNPQNYLSLSPLFFKLMTTSSNNWVLIKIIKLFGALTPLEPRLGKKLIEPLTNLIHNTSAMSLLYECINTVLAGVPDHHASIQLCVQKLRILIEDSDQNLKYLGLLAMNKILKNHPKSVQMHKDLILNCLEDKDESIRLRALDLLHGMVTTKNLIEIVKNLIRHLNSPNIGAHFRSELICKIVKICSQENYHYVASFEWYISVLVELAQLNESRNGELLANQLLDVAVRVSAVRAFAVGQMAILLQGCNQMTSRSNWSSLCEVIYAAAWICGEFANFLEQPRETLEAMLETASLVDVRGHIQSVLVLNALKLYCKLTAKWFTDAVKGENYRADDEQGLDHGLSEYLNPAQVREVDVLALLDRLFELTNFLMDKISLFVHSANLEVQERAVSIHQLLRLVVKRLAKLRVVQNPPALSSVPKSDAVNLPPDDLININPPEHHEGISVILDQEEDTSLQPLALANTNQMSSLMALQALLRELCDLFAGELNPVATKAQRKVPVPEGLDLDAWINEPPSQPKATMDRLSSPLISNDEKVSSKNKKTAHEHKPRDGLDETDEKGSRIFGGLVESESKPVTKLSANEIGEIRKQRLQMQESNPNYLKLPKEASSKGGVNSAELVDTVALPDAPGFINAVPPQKVSKLASSDKLAREMQKQFKEMSRKNSPKPEMSHRKNVKKQPSKHLKEKKYDNDDDDDDFPSNIAAVSTVVDLPEGVDLTELDSPDEEMDPNDPHRLLNIPFDLHTSTSLTKGENPPVEGRRRQKKTINEKKKHKSLNHTMKKSNGGDFQIPSTIPVDDYVTIDEAENQKPPRKETSTPSTTKSFAVNLDNTELDFWLHGVVDSNEPTKPQVQRVVVKDEATFSNLLAGGTLTASVRNKVRCPAAVSGVDLGQVDQEVLVGLLQRLCDEIPGLTVIESVGLNASLYAETEEKHPACLLLKISATTGSVSIECKALRKQHCEELVQKIKPIIKKYK